MSIRRGSTMATALVVLALVLVGLALGGCGSSSSSSSSSPSSSSSSPSSSSSGSSAAAAPASGQVTVAISGYKFAPATLVVTRGTKVTFVNHDQTAHTATASGAQAFDSGTIKPGAHATVIFHKGGTYPYICQFHAFMHGTVLVK